MSQFTVEQLRSEDVAEPERLRLRLNNIFLTISKQIALLTELAGLDLPDAITFETRGALSPNAAPFPLRIALDPSAQVAGVVLIRLENLTQGAAVPTSAQDVKWKVKPGGGGILVPFITGLALNSKYLLRLAVIRG